MDEILQLLKVSIEDAVLSRTEKRELKAAITAAQFDQRKLDYLRSKIFDLALEHQHELSKEQLINWLENTSKLSLFKKSAESGINSSYFSPGTECRTAIIQQIRSARNSLKICVFTISDNEISEEIIKAHRRNIAVKIITDNDKCFDTGSDIEAIHQAKIPVKMDRTDSHMHHKFCVVDKERLITGSYNWTRSAAESNQENIILTDHVGMVKDFVKEFNRLWEKLADY